MGVFDQYDEAAYPFRYAGTIRSVSKIAGGTPTDRKVAEAWIRTKLGETKTEQQIQHLAKRAIEERGLTGADAEVTKDDIIGDVLALKNLNGFKRDENGIYLEGRHLKACLKEAISIAVAVDKLPARGWGKTNKGALSFAAEHIIIPEQELHLRRDGEPLMEADDVDQRFVSTWRGTGIQYEEVVLPGAEFDFTVRTDHEYSEREWAMIWLTAQQQGIGSSRSQGYGVFDVVRWERADAKATSKPAAKPKTARTAAPRVRQAAVEHAVDTVARRASASSSRTKPAPVGAGRNR